MKLANIGKSRDSRTKTINLKDLKDQDGNYFELPPDPENNFIIDPRPVFWDRYGFTFDFQIEDSTLTVTCTKDKHEGWAIDLDFRVYDRTKEDVPRFDSSELYIYWGLNRERPPVDVVTVKVHHTATKIKRESFCGFKNLIICDMTDAPIKTICQYAFWKCSSVRIILFPQGLKKIEFSAFEDCSSIEILVIPSTVTQIHSGAFRNCNNMRVVKPPDTLKFFINSACFGAVTPSNQFNTIQWFRERYDNFPLHKICYSANDVTIDAIHQCIQQHPVAATLSDEFGLTALHIMSLVAGIFLSRQKQVASDTIITNPFRSNLQGSISACFNANMSAAFVEDDVGKTPLDYLLEYPNTLDVHTYLVTSLCMHRNGAARASATQHYSFNNKRRRFN